MITTTATKQHLEGNTTLYDRTTGCVKSGSLSFSVDGVLASVAIDSEDTGLIASKAFTTPEQIEAITWIINTIQEVHGDIDVGLALDASQNANND